MKNRVAVIEVGSRAVRLLVADILPSGKLDVVDTAWEETGLATAAATGAAALDAKINEISEVITRFRIRAEERRPANLAGFGTDALRRFDELQINRLRSGLKSFTVLSPKREAEFSFIAGVMGAPTAMPPDAQRLVIDQGSGSVEVTAGRILAEGPTMTAWTSYPVGTTALVTMLRDAGATDKSIPQRAIDSVREHVASIFAEARLLKLTTKPIVLGSVATKLAWMDVRPSRLAAYDPRAVHGAVIRLGHIQHVLSMAVDDLSAVREEVDPHRQGSEWETVVAGSIGLEGLLKRQRQSEFVVGSHGTRYGVVWKLGLATRAAMRA